MRKRTMIVRFILLFLLSALFAVQAYSAMADEKVISLAGTWRFRLDPGDVGVSEKWFTSELEDTVKLPGTTDTNKKGEFKDEKAVDRLSRVWYWKGPAWYQRDVDIPADWQGKRVILFLERTKNTRVWVDDRDCGSSDTLSAFQIFDLTSAATPGRHTISILVDNSKLPPVGPSHAVDERTQSNWNGITGRIELRAMDPVWIEDAQVYPDAAAKTARVRVVVGNITGQSVAGRVGVSCRSYNVASPREFKAQMEEVNLTERRRSVHEFTYKPGEGVPLWDEFQPAMLCLELKLEAVAGEKSFKDSKTVNFGMRDFKRDGKRLTVNGRTVFLRGRLDCANYPLTGYPPMDKAGWERVLGILRDWGLNHVRFHSWCPPEAAFEAADELGMYFQVEFPNKRSGFKSPESSEAAHYNIDYIDVGGSSTNVTLYDYAVRESELIFRHFGNHPSFVMFTLGNELGSVPAMAELVARFRERDPRHLYAQASNYQHWNPRFAEGDDFWVTHKTGKQLPVRGAYFSGDYGGGHIYNNPPSTMTDYVQSIKDVPAPLISHEIAEFQVTPDFREIPKYTGVLKARNLEIFQQRLKDANMLDLSHDFMRASGALAAICQREDLEAALRTPGFDGFQWLDIQDFPGQGTALVGMLNVFMESKGIIEPSMWRQFCCETVPLLLMEKYTWATDETFSGEIKIAHYGAADLPDASVIWSVGDGKVQIGSGVFGPVTVRQGEVFPVGRISVPLEKVKAPARLTVSASIQGTAYRNQYNIWVYPQVVDTKVPAGVLVTNRLDAAVLEHLDGGGKVLLFPVLNELTNSVKGAFPTDFWCWPMFAKGAIDRGLEPAPGTQGFICDPAHPALAEFPTEFHSNWQWWQIVKNSRPVILDETPADYRPIIHVIDNFARNHKLGLLFETKVGKGSLLVCASDLPALQDHPEARQLMYSLLKYVGSQSFRPSKEVGEAVIRKLPGGDQ